MNAIIEVKGNNGTLKVYKDKVVIRKLLSRTDKEFFIKNITGVELKKGTMFLNGHIQINHSGSSNVNGKNNLHLDENTIVFWKKKNNEFEKAKELIYELSHSPQKIEGNNSNINELEKLSELKDKGVITEDEFTAKKKQILGL